MRRLTIKNLLARKVRLIMSTLSIVLGVGFLTGVLTFSNGLQSTFDGIIEGSTTDGIVRPVGSESMAEGTTTDESVALTPADVEKLRALPEVKQAEGNIDGQGMYLLDPNKKLIGAQGAPTIAFNYFESVNLKGEETLLLEQGKWPTKAGEIVLDQGAAERAGYKVGDTVIFIPPYAKPPTETAKLVGTANFNGGGTAGATLAIFDTKEAQRLFLGGKDVFTSVALTAADGVSQKELAAAAKKVVPPSFTAVTGDQVVKESKKAVGQFLGVITQFLIVFALIAIVVGAFIIANTFNILVAQRVRELALLRALGASRKQVTRSVLLEAFLMSVIASTIGILLGLGLARGLAGLFRAVGLDIAGEALTLTAPTIITAYVVGVLVTMVSAFVPARRAAKVAPVAAMRDDSAVAEGSLRRRFLIASVVSLLALGAALWGLAGAPGNDTAWVGAAAVIWILTLAAVSPIIGRPVLQLARIVFTKLFGATGQLAGENALRNPRRTGATASALMIGLALVSAIGVLAASMNASAEKMVDDQFTADYLVQGASFTPFPTSIGDAIEETEGVAKVSRQQIVPVKLGDKTLWVAGVTPDFKDIYSLDAKSGKIDLGKNNVLLSTDRAKELGLKVGDELKTQLPGNRKLVARVAGIFEPTPVTSSIVVPMQTVSDLGVERTDSDVSVMAADGVDKKALKKRLDKVVEDVPIVTVNDKEGFSKIIRSQINQLLYMIYGLLALAIIIAIIGIVNTLGLSVIERTREIGLLRAIGLSRARLRRMITLESVAIALLGALLGMALGLVIGVLVRQTLTDQLTELSLPYGSLAVFLVLAVIVGVMAAIIPAIRASRMKVLDAIATE